MRIEVRTAFLRDGMTNRVWVRILARYKIEGASTFSSSRLATIYLATVLFFINIGNLDKTWTVFRGKQ